MGQSNRGCSRWHTRPEEHVTTEEFGRRLDGRQRHHGTPLLPTFERLWVDEVGDAEEELPSVLCRAAARALGMDGAGLCVQVEADLRLPLGASDELSATAERLQFTTGEGPCFEAMAQGRPVITDRASMLQRWPVLAVLQQEVTPFETGLAIPLRAGGGRFGVLDLYSRRPQSMDGHDVVAAQLIAQAIADVLLEVLGFSAPDAEASGAEASADRRVSWLDSSPVRRRRDVWVAIGMANLTLGLPHDDAIAVLRAAAVARSQSLDHLAHEVINGDVQLEDLVEDREPGGLL